MVSEELTVLKESPSELVVFKPAGLASELPNEHAGTSVKSLLAARHPGTVPKLPHRLDRVSCGILLVCLNDEAIAFHNQEIRERHWEKYYLARVAAPKNGSASDFLGEHKAFLSEVNGRARVVRSGGKPSRLEILAAEPVPGFADRIHLLIRLMTGRFHQIRVMCAELGLPLAGDPLYDPSERDPAEFYLEHIVLKYTDFDTRSPATIFLPNQSQRGALAPRIETLLSDIAARERIIK